MYCISLYFSINAQVMTPVRLTDALVTATSDRKSGLPEQEVAQQTHLAHARREQRIGLASSLAPGGLR